MIDIEHISKTFGSSTHLEPDAGGKPASTFPHPALKAIDDLSLNIPEGVFCTLVGPSGCGKSTLLRMINAMIVPDAGRIRLRGTDIGTLKPDQLRRGIGYVIQSVGLFPHWTVADNILTVPRLLRWPKDKCLSRLDEIVALTEIDPVWLARYPKQLSGGQQQRVGVARALAADPDIILMDEPFAALDPPSRANLQAAMRRIHSQSKKTIIFVTHDIDEALRLADVIVLINKGRIAQMGPPQEILARPENEFVQNFIGGTAPRLRLLDLEQVATRMRPEMVEAPAILADASLKEALNLMLSEGSTVLAVQDQNGQRLGSIHIADLVEARHEG
jgi:osmoprotectant transport system ATP-binding protein